MQYSEYLDHLEQIAKEKWIPFRGKFELTGKCNLGCKFCYVSSKEAKKSRDLTTEQWMQIITQATDAGMMRASLSGGEVFMRPDFEEIYCKTYDMGVRITLLTNGMLVDDNIIRILKKRPPDGISMTLYGASDESYEKISGKQGCYTEAVRAIDLMVKHELPLSLKTIALPELVDDFLPIRKLADERGLDLNLVRYVSPKRYCESESDMEWRLSPQQIQEAIRIVENNDSELSTQPKVRTGLLDCNCAKGRFAVCHDGRLVGCLSYTELYTYPLEEGFMPALLHLRELIAAQREHCTDCSACTFQPKCSMCPGLNYSESGSLSVCSKYRKELAKHGIL